MIAPLIIGRDGKVQRSVRGFPTIWNMACRCLALDTTFPRNALTNGYERRHMQYDQEQEAEVLSGCFWLVRAEAVQQVKGLDEGYFIYAEDVDWCRRFRASGWRVLFSPIVRAIHYGGASSANAPVRFAVEMQKADLRYWMKHHTRPGAFMYYLVSLVQHSTRAVGHGIVSWVQRSTKEQSRHKSRRSAACLGWLLTQGWRVLIGPKPKLVVSRPEVVEVNS
jgi:GT2 family glycosyltransferase